MLDAEVLKEWHPTKNSHLDLNKLTFGSGKKAYWICSKGHEWQAAIITRTTLRTKCPYCAGQKASLENNLAIKFPDLLKEWNYSKNELAPECYTPHSNKKVWWVCSKGHEWQSAPNTRLTMKSGCPYCSGNLPTSENNLAVRFPDLLKEWDYLTNTKEPSFYTPYSSSKVSWVCQVNNNHRWKASIAHRTAENQGCPYCAGQKVSIENSLASKFPLVSQQWDWEKNANLTPQMLTSKSSKKVWWLCSKGHSWKIAVKRRTHEGANCPYCTNRIVCSDNNLLVKFPEIAKEWHPTKNGNTTSDKVTWGSEFDAWWLCEKGHEWRTRVYQRTSNLTNCPFCSFIHTNLEKHVEGKLNLVKFNKFVLINARYKPDFQLSDSLYLNTDGLYWHSECQKDRDYHVKLRQAFETENKRILQFYEDEIYNKWSIVESIINNALGKTKTKLNARDCEMKLVPNKIASEFYEINHLMGKYKTAKHYGLYYENELVSLMSIRQFKDILELSRFCNKINTNIRGSFSKLLNYIIKMYSSKIIVSYCDLRYATGKSYEKVGFKLANISQGWCWTDNTSRYNRLQCRASNGKTERENAHEKGWVRIYDAGQAKYVLSL